jgi:ABC-type enterochelin transport system permease subunit
MTSTLKRLVNKYSKNLSVDRSVILDLIGQMEDQDLLSTKNIVHIHINELKLVKESSLWNSVNFSFVYVDEGKIFNINKNLLVIYYVAAVHDKFTIDNLSKILTEISDQMEHDWFFDDIRENFVKCLKVNRKLKKEVQLWLKLKQQ